MKKIIEAFGGLSGIELAVRNEIIAPLFKDDMIGRPEFFRVEQTRARVERGHGRDGRVMRYEQRRAEQQRIAQIWFNSELIKTEGSSLFGLYTSENQLIRLNKAHHPMLLKAAEKALSGHTRCTVTQEYIDTKTPVVYTLREGRGRPLQPTYVHVVIDGHLYDLPDENTIQMCQDIMQIEAWYQLAMRAYRASDRVVRGQLLPIIGALDQRRDRIALSANIYGIPPGSRIVYTEEVNYD